MQMNKIKNKNCHLNASKHANIKQVNLKRFQYEMRIINNAL